MQRPNGSVSFNGDKDVVMFKMIQAARRNLKTDTDNCGIDFGKNIDVINDASYEENRNVKNIRKKIKHQSESYSSDEDDRVDDRIYNKHRQQKSPENSKRKVGCYTPKVKISRSSNRNIDSKPSLKSDKRFPKDLKRKHDRSNRDDGDDEEY